MAVKISPIWVGTQFFDSSGKPLSGGQIFQYQAGTTTLQATFTDNTGTVQNANPIILDSAGRYSNQIWFTVGLTYKLVLETSTGTILLTEDFLSGVNDTSAGTTSEWLPQSTPTFVSSTSFTVAGNQTALFQVGRRVQATLNSGFAYSTIASSVFGAVTTVTVTNDSTALDNTISAVSIGFLGETNPSVPQIIPYNTVAFHAHRSTNQTSGTTFIFDTIDNQSGGANYSGSTGVFTAPYTGWYLFQTTTQIQNTSGGNLAEAAIISANSSQVARSDNQAVPSGTSTSFTTGTVVFLSSSQTVSVITSALSATFLLVGGTFSSFSGCLLQRTA